MKREGRQHGVVRSFPILPTPLSRQRRYVKPVDPVSVTGTFTKVSTKPTNQSKFTGKCGTPRCLGCHMHPVCKSKDKAKGTMKLRYVGFESGITGYTNGTSVVEALAYLASDDRINNDYDYDDYGENSCFDEEFGSEVVREEGNVVENEGEDESVSYCDVGCKMMMKMDGIWLESLISDLMKLLDHHMALCC